MTMRISYRASIGLLAGALLALAPSARAAEADKYLPEQAAFASFTNVRQIVDSPLVKKHALEKLRDKLKENDEITKVLESLGFDPFKDLNTFVGAGSSFDPDGKAFLIAHGNFDAKKFEDKAEEEAKNHGDILKVHKQGDHKVYEVKPPDSGDDKPIFVAVVDKGTIVASNDKDYVVDCFAVAAGSKTFTVKKELKELLDKVDAKQSWWFVMPGTVLNKGPVAQLAQQDDKAKKILEKIESVALGITIEKDFKLTLGVGSKNAENAKELAEDLKDKFNDGKQFLIFFASQNKQLEPLVDAVNATKIGAEGNSVALKFELSEEVIEKALKHSK